MFKKSEDPNLNLNFITNNEHLTPELRKKMQYHEEICNYIHDLYTKKNRDYGDSMHPLYEEYGLTAFMILFSTKINRIKSLIKCNDKPNYESIEDSLMDLANYAIIAVTELKAEKTLNDDKLLREVLINNRPSSCIVTDENLEKK